MLCITKDSHIDHDLKASHLQFLFREFGDRDGFFIATVDLPEELPPLPCALYGPVVGDDPITDEECFMGVRDGRNGESRMIKLRVARPSRQMTVIAGPHGHRQCVLYTAFGGPLAEKEPWDTEEGSEAHKKSLAFWATHALAE